MVTRVVVMLMVVGLLGGCQGVGQVMTAEERGRVEAEVNRQFKEGMAAGEKADIEKVFEVVSDQYDAGFISGGTFYSTKEALRKSMQEGFERIESQKFHLFDKRITVLSSHAALVTTKGEFTAQSKSNNVFSGKFAWTFVYAKIEGEWKVIHSHQSMPQ